MNHVKSGFFFASKRNEIFASISNFTSEGKVRAHPTWDCATCGPGRPVRPSEDARPTILGWSIFRFYTWDCATCAASLLGLARSGRSSEDARGATWGWGWEVKKVGTYTTAFLTENNFSYLHCKVFWVLLHSVAAHNVNVTRRVCYLT
jgi:hypothetical protein